MLRVQTRMTGAPGSPYYSTFHFGGSTEGEADAAHAATAAFWNDLAAEINTAVTIEVLPEVDVVDALTGNVTGTFLSTAVSIDCVGGSPLPPSNQGLIRWRTGDYVGGREIRGKTFVPMVPSEYASNGKPAASYIAALQSAVTALFNVSGPAGGFVIYSDTHHQAAEVTAGSPWSEFAVLRSRRD